MIVSRANRNAVLIAAAALAVAGSRASAANLLTWDPGQTGGATPGGSGTWDTTTANWASGGADQAWVNANNDDASFGGTAGTVTLGTGINAENLTFNTDGYTISGANTLTLGGTTPTVTVSTGTATINSAIAGSLGLTTAGPGTLVLGGTNTFTGGLTINSGQVNFTSDANLGAAGGAVTLNGGTFSYAGTSGGPTIARVITIGASGGTINTQAAGGNGKFVLNTANGKTGQLAGSTGGALKKTGGGWLTIYGGAASGSNFTTEIDGGVVELGSSTGLGSGAVTLAGGDLSLNNSTAVTNAINVNSGGSGTFGIDGGNFTYAGTLTNNGALTIQLGDFWGATNRSMTFNSASKLAGGGTIQLSNGNGATPTLQNLTLAGDNTGYTGTLTVDGGHIVQFNTPKSLVSLVATSSATAIPVVAMGYDHTAAATLSSFPTVDSSGADAGVLAYAAFSSSGTASDNIDLSTLYGGKWFLGATPANASFWGTITPGVDGSGNRVYRLGGGGGGLYVGNPVLKDYTDAGNVTHTTGLLIGDPRLGGGGTINIAGAESYTGSTTIANGTLALAANGTNHGSLPATTVVTFGTATTAGTLNLGGFNTTVAGLAVAAGANAANQVIGNSSTATNSVLTIDTTNGSTTFGGIIKDTLGSGNKNVALTVQGTTPGNGLTLAGANTYTGATTVNGGGLYVNGSLAATPVTVAAGGTLGGTGTVGGAVANSGHVAPGSGGAGKLTVANAVSLANGSFLDYDLNTPNQPGGAGGNDFLSVAGLTLGQGITLNVTPGAGLGSGTYHLIGYSGALADNSGNFTGWTVSGLPAGDTGTFQLGAGTVDLLVSAAAVPEPGTLGLLEVAALGLIARRRRHSL